MPLSVSDGAGKWIDDFVNSTDKRFAGKSKEKRKQMALGAYYSAKRKKESMALFTSAQYLLELSMPGAPPNQNPLTKNSNPAPTAAPLTTPPPAPAPSPSYTGSTSAPSTPQPAPQISPSVGVSQPMPPTTAPIPSLMPPQAGDSMMAQGALPSSPADISMSSTYNTGTGKDLSSLTAKSTKPSTSIGDSLGKSLVLSLVQARFDALLDEDAYMFGTIGDKPKPLHARINDFVSSGAAHNAIHSAAQKVIPFAKEHHAKIIATATSLALSHMAHVEMPTDQLEDHIHHTIEHLGTNLSVSKTMAHQALKHAVHHLMTLRGIKEESMAEDKSSEDKEMDDALRRLHKLLKKIEPKYTEPEPPKSEPKPKK
jgi:hypothetical protein